MAHGELHKFMTVPHYVISPSSLREAVQAEARRVLARVTPDVTGKR
jgi:hypothetical protein